MLERAITPESRGFMTMTERKRKNSRTMNTIVWAMPWDWPKLVTRDFAVVTTKRRMKKYTRFGW